MSNCFIDSIIIFFLLIQLVSVYKLHNSRKKFNFNQTLNIFKNKNVWIIIPLFIYSVKNYNINNFLNNLNLLSAIYFLHFYNVIPLILKKVEILALQADYSQTLILLLVLISNLISENVKKNSRNFHFESFK